MTQHILLPDMHIRVPGRRISHILGGGGGIMPVLGQVGGKLVVLDTFDTLDPAWTWLLGTGVVSGGALRAATIVVDGYNLITNPEFTVNLNGWNPYGAATTLTRRDFTSAPDIDPTGGLDDFGLEVKINTGYTEASAYRNAPMHSVTYVLSMRVYSPSANVSGHAALQHWQGGPTQTAHDTWETLNFTYIPVGFLNSFSLVCKAGAAGDVVYGDMASFQLKAALAWHAGFRRTDGTFTAGVPMPATATTPRSLAFRIVDALNFWEVRVLPNTAANDTFIIEHVAGVQTTRGTPADVDWTAGAVDEIMVDVRGDDISVSHKKSGAGSWTAATSYLTMATGLAADKHGVDLYQTGVDQLTYWQAAA